MPVAGLPLLEDDLLTGMVQQFPYNRRKYPLTSLFTPNYYSTDEILWDIVAGTRGMATLTTLNGEGTIIARDGVRQGRATPCHFKEKMALTNSEMSLLRAPGAQGAPGTAGNPEGAERAIVRNLQKLAARRNERREWLCRSALQTGTITYSGDNVSFEVDLGLTSLTAPSTDWDDAGATIVRDIYSMITEFADNAGFPPNILFFNPKLFHECLLKNTEFMNLVKSSPGLSESVLNGATKPFQIHGISLTWVPVMGQHTNDAGSTVDNWTSSKITLAATETDTGMAPFEWAGLKNEENKGQAGPVARSWQETGDSHQVWMLVYDNGLPIIPDQKMVQPVTVWS